MCFSLCAFADEAGNSLDEQINALKSNDISLLEIRGVNGKNIIDLSEPELLEINDKLNANGIKIWSFGSPVGKINITESFEEHLDKFKRLLELAEKTQTENIRMFSFFVPNNHNPDVFRDSVFERLDKFVEIAKDYNVTLCHENEKNIYGDTLERCLDIHKTFSEIKMVFDPANFVQCSVDTIKAFKELAPYIKYMHIKDVDQNGTLVPAGKGIANIRQLLSLYSDVGSVLTLEPHLKIFDGLESLEGGNKSNISSDYVYRTNREAFDIAANALKKLL